LLRPGSCGLFDAPPGAGEGEELGGVVGRPGGRGTEPLFVDRQGILQHPAAVGK